MKKEHFLLAVFSIIIVVALVLRVNSWLNKSADEVAPRPIVNEQIATSSSPTPVVDEQIVASTAPEFLLGGDQDEHGCIASAGYGWCETKQKCLRVWEEDCPPLLTSGTSTDQIEVALSYPLPGDLVSSPLEISGKARGYWFFEATLPISLVASDGSPIVSYYAQAEDEWMTVDFVPFSARLEFQTSAESGYLIISKDNPSDLPQYDASIRIPVKFKN